MSNKIMLALPSKGAIAEPTQAFLRDCGLKVSKPNPRQYTGTIKSIPEINVLFQRVKDVVYKVADGTAQLGITGLDVVREYAHEDDLIVIHESLGYGHCALVVAAPESWVDVESMADLVDVADDIREHQQRNLRVATTYTRSTRQFLHRSGIHHFTLVKAEGAIEAAPTIGYADIIVDLVQTGTTLRENHLKPIPGAVILESQACLIGNRKALQTDTNLLQTVGTILEYIDAARHGRDCMQMTVNIRGESAEEIGKRVVANDITRGLLGPTIAPIYSANGDNRAQHWFTVTITVHKRDLLDAVKYLREIGGSQIVTAPVNFVFMPESHTYNELLERLQVD